MICKYNHNFFQLAEFTLPKEINLTESSRKTFLCNNRTRKNKI